MSDQPEALTNSADVPATSPDQGGGYSPTGGVDVNVNVEEAGGDVNVAPEGGDAAELRPNEVQAAPPSEPADDGPVEEVQATDPAEAAGGDETQANGPTDT